MKNYKYFYAIGFSILGVIIGFGIGWLVTAFFLSLPSLLGIEISESTGYLFGSLTGIISFCLALIIGAKKGWKYGYKIGSKKGTTS